MAFKWVEEMRREQAEKERRVAEEVKRREREAEEQAAARRKADEDAEALKQKRLVEWDTFNHLEKAESWIMSADARRLSGHSVESSFVQACYQAAESHALFHLVDLLDKGTSFAPSTD